jgi:DNA-binding response OmpR family regulator
VHLASPGSTPVALEVPDAVDAGHDDDGTDDRRAPNPNGDYEVLNSDRTPGGVEPDRPTIEQVATSSDDPAHGAEQTATDRRVLVVEDDATLGDVVGRFLRKEGFEVEVVPDGALGLERALEWLPDLVVLDLMLPSMNGLDVCRKLREAAPIPVIMLTARAEEQDRVLGLEIGADDYVTKPFSPRELVLRINAVLRRATGPLTALPGTPLRAADLEVDVVAREVRRDGEVVQLTARELDLLVHLMRNPRRAFSRSELMETVWGWTYGDTSTVTVHVRRLRMKLEDDPGDPRHLVTIPGGYRFEP